MASFTYGWENVQYGTAVGQANAMLKEFYLPELRGQFDTASPFIERLKKVIPTELIGGKYAVIALELGFDPGGAANREGRELAHPGETQVNTSNVYLKELSHSIALTFRVTRVSRGGETSFVKAISQKVRRVARAWKHMLDRQSWGNGTGFIHSPSAVTHTAVANVANVTCTNATDLRHLFEGMYVDVIDVSNSTTINNGPTFHGVVTNIDRVAKTYDVDTEDGSDWAAVYATADFLLSAGPIAAAATANRKYNGTGTADTFWEIMGLNGIVSRSDPTTGALQGLAVGTYAWWKAQTSTAASNRTITEKLVLDACNLSYDEGGKPSVLLMNRQTYAAFANNLVGDKRHIGTTKLKSGMEVPTFDAAGNILPLLAMRQCPPNQMYIIDESSLHFVQAGPMDWITGGATDSILHWDIGNSRYVGSLVWFGNLACVRRNVNVSLENLDVT